MAVPTRKDGYWSRCKHPFCTDCATRRGSKRGIRRARRMAKQALRKSTDQGE